MNRRIRVTFVSPRTAEWPSGGHRVVLEHANHLARKGHVVTCVSPGRMVVDPTALDHLKNSARYLLRRLDGQFTPEKWLTMDPNVRIVCVPSLSQCFLPDADCVIATAWQTAEFVDRYTRSKGRKFYFIQHLETWNGPEQRVVATWKCKLRKIVISKWLAEFAYSLGETAICIPNGLDLKSFEITNPPDQRQPNHLMMLYHKAEWKGIDDGLEAIRLVREVDPGIRVTLFGVPERPDSLPGWIEYYQKPAPKELRELYNHAAIFVAPSHSEGWGLTGCEALLCGAALAATDIDGHREFAFDGKTALSSPVRDPRALSDNILRLIRFPEERIALAHAGSQFVRQFTWERASASFEAALCTES